MTHEQLGPSGRKVRCSKCHNTWHAQVESGAATKIEPTITESQADTTNTLEPGVNLPALLPIGLPFYLCSMPILLIAIIVFVCIELFSGSGSIIKTYMSYHGLNVKDINIEHQQDKGKIIVNYKILNSSDSAITIPMVRIRLFDKDGSTLQTNITDGQVAYGSAVTLNANQYLSVKTEFLSIPPSADRLDITVGSKLDFFLR